MSHQTPRTPNQNAKFRTLKDALNGDGPALEEVVEDFGDEAAYSQVITDYTVTEIEPDWEEAGSLVVPLRGGTYWADTEVLFSGTVTNRDFQLRILINGQQAGEILSRELKDPDDVIQFTTFTELPNLPAGDLTTTLEARISSGAGGVEFLIERWRVRIYRVKVSGTTVEGATTGGFL